MFNTKRIIFLIGLLSLVTLTGALLAGPAFAEPKSRGDHGKTLICHYNSVTVYALDEDGFPTSEVLEAIGWYYRNVDTASVEDHMDMHGDWVINGEEGQTTGDCDTVDVDLDGEADAAEQRAEDEAQEEEDRLDALETD